MFAFFEKLYNPFSDKSAISEPVTVSGFIIAQLIGLKKYIFFIALLSAVAAVIEIYIFKFVGVLVDEISVVSAESFFTENKNVLIQLFLVVIVALPVVDFVHTLFCNQTVGGNFPLGILANKHQYLIAQSMDFHQKEAAGKISNTLLQTAEASKQIIMKVAHTFIFALVFFLSMILLLTTLDAYLLVPVGIWFTAFMFVIFYFVPKLKEWSNKQAGARSEMAGKLVDVYTNIATVKLFSHSRTEKAYAQTYMSRYLDSTQAQLRFISKLLFILTLLNTALIFSTVVFSLLLWREGLITVGAIAAAISVVLRLYSMSHWIMWESVAMFNNYGIVMDGVKLLTKPSGLPLLKIDERNQFENGDICFEHVGFSYNGNSSVIKNFSLNIFSGEKIGVVGRSGSGKSTLTKLLLRFYKIDTGKITISGKDISLVEHEYLLKKISVVTQDVELLDRSVRENIVYGGESVSEADMLKAAEAAGVHKFIGDLIDQDGRRGYDASVGVRGAKLSGGQRQRISIARALLKNAPILVFDEATSALDSEIELEILENIKQFMADKTVIMIAHRVSALVGMDRIVVIDNGELIEIGSHHELKSKEGFYEKMLRMQSGNFTPAVLN